VEMREALLPLVRLAATLSANYGVRQKDEELGREKYGHGVIAAGERRGANHGAGLRIDLGEARAIHEESRCGAVSGISTEARRLRREPAAIRNQQSRRYDGARKLLVGSAQHILGPFGPDTDLRRYGLRLCERGGKKAKKRAAVAVARKLAVLLHRLRVSGEV
jgi:hypothetical protein